MVKRDRARLVGYLEAVKDQAGFRVPVFRSPHWNRNLVQEIDYNGIVSGFRDVEHPAIVYEPLGDLEVEVGRRAIMAYAMLGEQPFFGLFETVVARLEPRIEEIADPLLRLQAEQFCRSHQVSLKAWRDSHDHLAKISPRSAKAWRDVVVLPGQMREAIERAIFIHDLEIRTDNLGRDVRLHVTGKQLRLEVDEKIFDALNSDANAWQSFLRFVQPVCEAFSLDSNVMLRPLSARPEVEAPLDFTDPVVVVIGARAHTVAAVQGLAPPMEEIDIGRTNGTGYTVLMSGDADIQITALQGERILWQGWADGIPDLLLLPRAIWAGPVLFLFSVTGQNRRNLKAAIDVARRISPQDGGVIAVIPHLPDPALSKDVETYQQILADLANNFSAVILLSDQSLLPGAGLAFGPSHSTEAVKVQWSDLVARVREETVSLVPARRVEPGQPITVHVQSSILHDKLRSGGKMLEQTLVRARDCALSYTARTRAELGFVAAPREPGAPILTNLMLMDHGLSDLAPVYDRYWQKATAVLMLSGGEWSPVSIEEFPDQCRRELEQLGWRSTTERPSGRGVDFTIERSGLSLDVQCRAYGAAQGEKSLRTAWARQGVKDRIVVTDAAISRTKFMRFCLSGHILINFARLSVLSEIYNKRYLYTARALNRGRSSYDNLFFKSAFAYLAAACEVNLDDVGDELRDIREEGMILRANDCRIFTLGSAIGANLSIGSKKTGMFFCDVGITLSPDGWSVTIDR